jgi:hypothetical protein
VEQKCTDLSVRGGNNLLVVIEDEVEVDVVEVDVEKLVVVYVLVEVVGTSVE